MNKITQLFIYLILAYSAFGQGKGVGMEMKAGFTLQTATVSERTFNDVSAFKIYQQSIRPGLGIYFSWEAALPLSKKWDFNTGILVSYSRYKQLMLSHAKYGSGSNNGSNNRNSEVRAKINFIELGIPATFYYKFSNAKIGLSFDARYVFAPAVTYDIYESGIWVTDASVKNEGHIGNKNFAAGISFVTYPFYSRNLKNFGWGIDLKYLLVKNKLFLTETPTNRMIGNIYLACKLR